VYARSRPAATTTSSARARSRVSWSPVRDVGGLGLASYGEHTPLFLKGTGVGGDREYSEEPARAIDEEVRAILERIHDRVRGILTTKKAVLVAAAQELKRTRLWRVAVRRPLAGESTMRGRDDSAQAEELLRCAGDRPRSRCRPGRVFGVPSGTSPSPAGGAGTGQSGSGAFPVQCRPRVVVCRRCMGVGVGFVLCCC